MGKSLEAPKPRMMRKNPLPRTKTKRAKNQEEAQGEDEPAAEEETEEEEGDEADSEESEEETEEKEEPEAKLDWSKADPRQKAAFEEAEGRARKFERAHAKLQSQLTRDSRARQQEETTLSTLRVKAQAADQWDALLAKHPELQTVLEREIAKIRDPFKDVPEFLREDPIFQQMQRYNEKLEERLSRFEKNLKPVEDLQTERAEAKNRQQLDGLLSDAAGKFKSMFGREITQPEKAQILKYMIENKYYQSGTNVTLEVFGKTWEKHMNTARGESLKAKAKKFGARNKSLNTVRAGKKSNADSAEEAIAMALAEQGYGT
jgi:hypothetical protein